MFQIWSHRAALGGKSTGHIYSSNDMILKSKKNRESQLKARDVKRGSECHLLVEIERAEALIRLTDSFLGTLARQENSVLEVEHQSVGTKGDARQNLDRQKKETIEALKTFW